MGQFGITPPKPARGGAARACGSGAAGEELEAVLQAKLPDVLSDAQKRYRVKNLLADLSRRNLVAPERKGPGARRRIERPDFPAHSTCRRTDVARAAHLTAKTALPDLGYQQPMVGKAMNCLVKHY